MASAKLLIVACLIAFIGIQVANSTYILQKVIGPDAVLRLSRWALSRALTDKLLSAHRFGRDDIFGHKDRHEHAHFQMQTGIGQQPHFFPNPW